MDDAARLCTGCLRTLADHALVCAACGTAASPAGFDVVPVLIAALKHPSAEIRARAVIAIGRRREDAAIGELLALAMHHRADVVEGLMVVSGLTMIGAPAAEALGTLARAHPAHAVRDAAGRAHDKIAGRRGLDA